VVFIIIFPFAPILSYDRLFSVAEGWRQNEGGDPFQPTHSDRTTAGQFQKNSSHHDYLT
jgi:hypothetical protein